MTGRSRGWLWRGSVRFGLVAQISRYQLVRRRLLVPIGEQRIQDGQGHLGIDVFPCPPCNCDYPPVDIVPVERLWLCPLRFYACAAGSLSPGTSGRFLVPSAAAHMSGQMRREAKSINWSSV